MSKKNFKNTFLNIQNEDTEIEQVNQPLENIDEKPIEQSDNNENVSENLTTETDTIIESNETEKIEVEEKVVIVKDETDKVTVVTTTEISQFESLNDRIQRKVVEVEKEIKKAKRLGFGTGKKKMSFDDMYGGKTISMNRILKPLFDEICETSSITKAEIIERILINGIKNTNFNPPKDDED